MLVSFVGLRSTVEPPVVGEVLNVSSGAASHESGGHKIDGALLAPPVPFGSDLPIHAQHATFRAVMPLGKTYDRHARPPLRRGLSERLHAECGREPWFHHLRCVPLRPSVEAAHQVTLRLGRKDGTHVIRADELCSASPACGLNCHSTSFGSFEVDELRTTLSQCPRCADW